MTVQLVGAPVDDPLIGRDQEVDRIEDIVASIARGARFVVIRGDAGIGKTALWRWAVQRSRQAGYLTLATRGSVEADLHGPMVGLVELFATTNPAPGTLEPDVDRFVRGRAVLTTLRRLTVETPVVVAIDDVNWLDPVSAGALRYALRRVVDEPVLVLATERFDPSTAPDDRTIPTDRREEIFLGPLSLDATRIIAGTVADFIPRPTLARIHALSGGNPLYATELARAAELFDDSLETSVPPTLLAALTSRVAGVADSVLEIMQLAAAYGPASAAALARAAGVSDVTPLVTAAVESGLLTVGDDLLVRFAHPLLASVVLAGVEPSRRQVLHARLAATVDDADARARHLALSCTGVDAGAATELQEAATRAARRGASALAADFAWHSVRVTPPGDIEDKVRRVFAAIVHRAAAGHKATALAEGDHLVATLPEGPIRAEAIALRVGLDFDGGDEFLEQALAEAGSDDGLRGRILELRGWLDIVHRAEVRKGMALAEEALAIARRLDDPTMEMLAASTVAAASLLLGHPRDDLMDRALALAETVPGPRLGRGPAGVHARHCLWGGRLDEARTILEDLHRAGVQAGIEFQRPYRILDLAGLEIAAGNLAVAADLADDGIESAADAGNAQAVAWLCYPVGIVRAHLGDVDRASEAARVLQSRAADQDGRTRLVMAHHVRGMIALAAGDPAAALAALEPALQMARDVGVRLPSPVPVLPDAIEASALVGAADACADLAAELDEQAADLGQLPWVVAAAQRGRGLAALAAGDDDAIELLGDAAGAFDAMGYVIDAARALLLQGYALRRFGRRNRSADVLSDARRQFLAIGAEPWAALAAAELERVAPGREQAELTPMEARIAALVAAGKRNREIAGELFVSVSTVESHLTRMYRKLEVRSRTELARILTG